MKCQDVRTVIDTTPRREPMSETVKVHLGGCPDCRHFSDESRALLALLSTQPRVQAPADFDFKLRARIARAQSEPSTLGTLGPLGFLEKFWSRSFSWTQAATAAATLALVATFTAIHFTGGNSPNGLANGPVINAVPGGSNIAQVTGSDFNTAPAHNNAASALKTASPRNVVKSPRISLNSGSVASVEAPGRLASNQSVNDETTRLYNPEKGQIITASTRSTFVGAESSSLAKTVAFVPSI